MAKRSNAVKTAANKKAETKVEEVKVVETVAETAAEVAAEETAPKKTTRKKAETAEATPKKTARKTTKKAAQPEASVTIQYAGKEIVAKEVLEAATKAFQKANEGVAIESIQIYIKPEEGVAYYAVNGIGNDDYKVIL